MKIGFDNEKYLSEQSAEIRRRAAKYGKLYLEFGGKLMNDFHAARCLPGYDPNVKLRLLQSLKDQAEIILAVYAGDIEHKKMRADFGISYADDALKLIDDLKSLGLLVRGVVITRYSGQLAAQQFRTRLEHRGISVWYHYVTQGYPTDVETIVSENGYGKNEYVPTERPIVVVTAPGPGSGKLATCLSQLYHESRRGFQAAYSKFETFPVWNMPLEHPLNVAYEAATLDLNDKNLIDPYHLQAYGKTTVNYNRDVDAFPLLKAIWERMTKKECPYKSPTDMGVNRIGFGIVDDAVVQEASRQEVIRRYLRCLCDFAEGSTTDRNCVEKAESLMRKLDLKTEDRIPVEAARQAAQSAKQAGKGKAGGNIVSGAAIQLKDGRVVTGRNSDDMHAASAMMLNAIKALAGIPEQIPLISPDIIKSITHMKHDILKGGSYTSLNLDEAIIGLAISCTMNPAAQIAAEKLNELRGCEVHMTHIVTPGDEAGLRRLGCRYTSDPYYATNALFTAGQ